MADTIARLIFEANTAELKKANDELKKLAQESGKAAKSVNDGTKAKKKSSDETTKLTNKEKLLKDSLKKTGNETKKTTTATDKMTESLRRASNAAAVMTGPLGGVSGRLSFLATGMSKFGLAGIATGVALAAVTTAAKASLAAFAAYETQMFKLAAITRATGHAAGFTAAELDKMAIQVGRDTLASADGVRDLQAVLLSFGSIQGDVFRRAINASVDLSAVMGQTAASAGKTLAKALEDPINNLSAMTRAGILFSDAEKAKIKELKESNKLLEAQDMILKKLEGNLGGAGAGGGLAAATDLLGENITAASIEFARASGLANTATKASNNLANMFGGMAEVFKAMGGTDEQRLAKAEERFASKQARFFEVYAENKMKALVTLKKGVDDEEELIKELREKIAQTKDDEKEAAEQKEIKERPPEKNPTLGEFEFEEDDVREDPLQALRDKIAKEKEF